MTMSSRYIVPMNPSVELFAMGNSTEISAFAPLDGADRTLPPNFFQVGARSELSIAMALSAVAPEPFASVRVLSSRLAAFMGKAPD